MLVSFSDDEFELKVDKNRTHASVLRSENGIETKTTELCIYQVTFRRNVRSETTVYHKKLKK